MTGVVTSTGVRKCDRSQDIRPESGIRPEPRPPSRVRHMTELVHTTEVMMYLHYKHI
jgi:hypothetical protein